MLRVYRIDPHFKTKSGGPGTIDVEGFISLHDPNHKISFPIVASGVTYPGSAIPVDEAIRDKRLLTVAISISSQFAVPMMERSGLATSLDRSSFTPIGAARCWMRRFRCLA